MAGRKRAGKVGKRDKNANGEGSVYQRSSDGKWVAAVVVGYRPDGRPKRRYVYANSREEALMELRKIQVEATWHRYDQVVRRYLYAKYADTRLSKLTAQHLQALYGEMLANGLSPRMVHYLHTVLSPALRPAAETGLIHRNPAAHVKLPRHRQGEMQALTPDEAVRFLESVREDRLHALWQLALRTGMRPSEYLALKWEDVDLKAGTATVRRTLQRVAKKNIFGEPKTARGRRTVHLTRPAIEALEKWWVRQLQERLITGPKWQDTGLVFRGLNM